MKKSQHKILALLLAVLLVAGVLPMMVSAAEILTYDYTYYNNAEWEFNSVTTEGDLTFKIYQLSQSYLEFGVNVYPDDSDPDSPLPVEDFDLTAGTYSVSFKSDTGGISARTLEVSSAEIEEAIKSAGVYSYTIYSDNQAGPEALAFYIYVEFTADGGGEPPVDPDPEIKITTQPAANTPVTVGEINKTLSIVATPPDNESLSYEWYQNTTGNASGGDVVGATATLTIPTDLAIGTYYFYCVVSADGLDDAISSVAKVTVSAKDTTPPSEPEPEPDDNDDDDDRRPFIPSSDDDDDDNDDDYGRRTTSGGGGGGGGSSAPTVNTPVTVSSSDATASVTNALANATNGSATAKLTNPGDVSLGTLQSMANQAGNTELKVNADSLNGNAVDVRITLDPSAATSALNLSASTVNPAAESRKAQFEKFFSNDLMAVSLGQQGSFGMPVTIAAKLDPTLDTDNLVFYSYNSTTNTYTAIAAPAYWVDANGYVHFTTTLGGSIVISDGALARK